MKKVSFQFFTPDHSGENNMSLQGRRSTRWLEKGHWSDKCVLEAGTGQKGGQDPQQ